jgi:lipopolysaccharide transport system ATP-binding protein
MSQYVIKAENISKRYQLGAIGGKSTLRDRVGDVLSRPFQRKSELPAPPVNTDFWALKGVTFEIAAGEVVGFIGHNGSGKSTLLRILSRISRPTTGRFRIYGNVGALLEIGTGFHPDLTGRENVFLNASILGMTRKQVLARFDEIVAFAEVEQFIDTPIKFYSSGMYVRLAFAVATHLDAEILLLDEVLGVGDYGFQQKSTAKLTSIIQDGRTVVLVSHMRGQIDAMCSRVLWLHHGELIADGPPTDIMSRYLESFQT